MCEYGTAPVVPARVTGGPGPRDGWRSCPVPVQGNAAPSLRPACRAALRLLLTGEPRMRYLSASLALSALGLALYILLDAGPVAAAGASSLALMTFAVAAFSGPEP